MPELSITEANYAGCCEHPKGSLTRPPDVLLVRLLRFATSSHLVPHVDYNRKLKRIDWLTMG